MHALIAATLRDLHTVGIVDRSKGAIVPAELAQRRGNTEEILPVGRFYDHADVVSRLETTFLQFYKGDNDTLSLAYKIAVMHVAPNVKFSEEATAQSVATAVDAVPRTIGFVQENERIVSKHERITPEIRLKLESLRRIKVERGPASDSTLQLFGTMLHATILVSLYAIYLYFFRKRIFNNNRRLALIALLILWKGSSRTCRNSM
jgi:membrane-associated HD superfamily phosphohydrolase